MLVGCMIGQTLKLNKITYFWEHYGRPILTANLFITLPLIATAIAFVGAGFKGPPSDHVDPKVMYSSSLIN